MNELTAGFSTVTQISEDFLNRLLRRLYDTNVIPHEFSGMKSQFIDRYGILLELSYAIQIGVPRLRFDDYSPRRAHISLELRGSIVVHSVVEDGPDVARTEYSHLVEIQSGEVTIAADVALSQVPGETERGLEFSFRNIPYEFYQVMLRLTGVPSGHTSHIMEIIRRILYANLLDEVKRLPLSHKMETEVVGEFRITDLDFRTVRRAGKCAIAIFFNSLPNSGAGVFAHLANQCDTTYDFAIALDGQLISELINLAVRRGQIPTRFNESGHADPQGKIRLRDLVVSVRQDTIRFSLQLSHDILVAIPVWINGGIRLRIVNGFLTGIVHDVEVEISIFEPVIQFLGLTVVWLLVTRCLRCALGVLVEEAINVELEEFVATNRIRLAFSGEVPGGQCRLVAQVSDIVLRDNELGTRGQVLIEDL